MKACVCKIKYATIIYELQESELDHVVMLKALQQYIQSKFNL